MFRESIAVAVDTVLMTVDSGILKVLLIRRKNDPYKGKWALPGGFVRQNEEIRDAAVRELKEETGVFGVKLTQFHTFGGVSRDPRGRVVTVSYIAFLPLESELEAASDAIDADWFPMHDLPELAFDHDDVVSFALAWLKPKIEHSTMCKYLLPENFTIQNLQTVYEAILGGSLDEKEFVRHMINSNTILKINSKKKEKNYHFNPEIVALEESLKA